jgi:hypothetical protein
LLDVAWNAPYLLLFCPKKKEKEKRKKEQAACKKGIL